MPLFLVLVNFVVLRTHLSAVFKKRARNKYMLQFNNLLKINHNQQKKMVIRTNYSKNGITAFRSFG
jgi:hypothetical protein